MIFASFTTVSYKKFYLFKDEDGVKIEEIRKYFKTRYINSNMSYNYISHEEDGNKVELSYNNRNNANILVYGKNRNADSLVLNINEDEYGMQLENNEYFLAIYPEELELNNEVVENIYDGNEDFKFSIKFLDKDEREVKNILLVKENN